MPNSNTQKNVTKVEIQLMKLKEEHKKIDDILSDIENPILDTFLIRRLKKEKLILKDKIQKISNQLTPDIIA